MLYLVAALEFLDHFLVLMPFRFHGFDGLVNMRVKDLALALNRSEPRPFQHIEQFPVNQLHARVKLFGNIFLAMFETPFERIQRRKQSSNQAHRCMLKEIFLFTLNTFAHILQLGLLANQALKKLLFLAQQLPVSCRQVGGKVCSAASFRIDSTILRSAG